MPARHTLLFLCRATMEAAWLTSLVALASLLTGYSASLMPGFLVFALTFAAFAVAFVLQRLDFSDTQLQLAGMALAAAAVNGTAHALVTGQPAFWDPFWAFGYIGGGAGTVRQGLQTALALSLGVCIWWRGARVADGVPTFATTVSAFRSGLVFVAIQAILEGFSPLEAGAAGMPLPFFTAGLLALALAHLDRVDPHGAIRLKGLAGVLPAGVVAALAGVAAILGALPYAWVGNALGRLGDAFALATTIALFGVLFGLGLLAELLINFFNSILAAFRTPFRLQQTDDQFLERLRQQQVEPGGVPQLFIDLARDAVLLVLIIIALVILARAFRRARDRGMGEPAEERSSAWGEDGGVPIPGWLRRLLGGGPGSGVPAGLLGVFRLYFRLLQWAARAGIPREPWRTPYEFQRRLEQVLGPRAGLASGITSAFVEARYGGRTPEAPRLERLEGDFQALSTSQPAEEAPGAAGAAGPST